MVLNMSVNVVLNKVKIFNKLHKISDKCMEWAAHKVLESQSIRILSYFDAMRERSSENS